MSVAAKEILESALKLDPTERKRIALELLESIGAEPLDPELSPAWEAEIEQRLHKIASGKATFVSADAIYGRAEDLLRGR